MEILALGKAENHCLWFSLEKFNNLAPNLPEIIPNIAKAIRVVGVNVNRIEIRALGQSY